MSRKPRANIAPEFIGELYTTDGQDVYRLISCQTEPHAVIQNIVGEHSPTEKPISQFANFVRLLPERPIAKPRKERADKGSHKPTKTVEPPQDGGLLIRVPSGVGEDTDYTVMIAGSDGTGKTMKEAVTAALEKFGGEIPDILTAKAKKQIQYILDPKKQE